MFKEQQQIYWYSGLYLQPQHFQSQDLHTDWRFSQQNLYTMPWHFGIIDLQCNEEALNGDILDIKKLRVIMPNGDYLSFPDNCQLTTRSFSKAWLHRDRPFSIWLGLPHFNPNTCNVGTHQIPSKQLQSRWATVNEDAMMNDVYHHGPAAEINHIQFNAQLIWENEKEDFVDYCYLPLIRLHYDNQNIVIDEKFIPPCVTLMSYQGLYKIAQNIYFYLASQARKLSDYKRNIQLNSVPKLDKQLVVLFTLRTIHRILPLLKQYLAAPQLHPWHYYLTLMQLIGELSTFNEKCDFLGEWQENGKPLADYDHYQIQPLFQHAYEVLQKLINELIFQDTKNHQTVYFTPKGDGLFYAKLDDVLFKPQDTIILAIQSADLSRYQLEQQGKQKLKLSSIDNITNLISYALSGARLTLYRDLPVGLQAQKLTFYFAVDRYSDEWGVIEKQKNCAFFYADAPADLDIKLLVMAAT